MLDFTDEEKEFYDKLRPAPNCMHDPEYLTHNTNSWTCKKCGLVAVKNVWVPLIDFRKMFDKIKVLEEVYYPPYTWISVKDGLPDKNARYLVFFDNIEPEYCIGFSSFFVETKEFNHTNITHWMPLPPPPTTEETT